MRIVWGVVAGLGMAGLLVAGAPAQAQTGSSGSSSSYGQSSRDQSTAQPSSPSSSQDKDTTGSMGTGSTSGSMGSSSSSMGMGNEVTGKVTKFDKSNNQLSLQLPLSDSTQVTKNGQPATLNDIKEGDQVRASFSGTGSQIKVNKIDVLSSGGAGSSPGTGSSGAGSSPSGSSQSGSSGSSSRGY